MQFKLPVSDNVSSENFILASFNDKTSSPPTGYLAHDCLLTSKGEIAIAASYYLSQPRFGLIDAASGFRSQRKDCVMDCHGSVVIPWQAAYFSVTEPDRIIKIVLDPKFDSGEWRGQTGWGAKWDQFAKFLNDYDFIGMPYEKVVSLLGKGIELNDDVPPPIYRCSYSLLSGPCGNGWRGINVEFEDRKVKRWRFASAMERQADRKNWYEENMIYDNEFEQSQERLICKRKASEK
jgi:hypothetical protein